MFKRWIKTGSESGEWQALMASIRFCEWSGSALCADSHLLPHHLIPPEPFGTFGVPRPQPLHVEAAQLDPLEIQQSLRLQSAWKVAVKHLRLKTCRLSDYHHHSSFHLAVLSVFFLLPTSSPVLSHHRATFFPSKWLVSYIFRFFHADALGSKAFPNLNGFNPQIPKTWILLGKPRYRSNWPPRQNRPHDLPRVESMLPSWWFCASRYGLEGFQGKCRGNYFLCFFLWIFDMFNHFWSLDFQQEICFIRFSIPKVWKVTKLMWPALAIRTSGESNCIADLSGLKVLRLHPPNWNNLGYKNNQKYTKHGCFQK